MAMPGSAYMAAMGVPGFGGRYTRFEGPTGRSRGVFPDNLSEVRGGGAPGFAPPMAGPAGMQGPPPSAGPVLPAPGAPGSSPGARYMASMGAGGAPGVYGPVAGAAAPMTFNPGATAGIVRATPNPAALRPGAGQPAPGPAMAGGGATAARIDPVQAKMQRAQAAMRGRGGAGVMGGRGYGG